jgi:hypothetical protein
MGMCYEGALLFDTVNEGSSAASTWRLILCSSIDERVLRQLIRAQCANATQLQRYCDVMLQHSMNSSSSLAQ